MQVKKTILLPWISTVILVFICGWLGFHVIDQSVSLDHQSQYSALLIQQRNVLVRVLNSTGTCIDENAIRKEFQNENEFTVFEKERGQLIADQVSFQFSNGKLFKVDAGQQ